MAQGPQFAEPQYGLWSQTWVPFLSMLLVNRVGILTSQRLSCLSFLICKVSLIEVPTSLGYCEDGSESIGSLES